VLLAKLETIPHGMIYRLIEIGICYEMEINVQIINLMAVSRLPIIDFDRSKTERVCGIFQLPG
jgi:hypothetical protein